MKWDYRIDELARKDLHAMGPSAARKIRDFLEKRIKNCLNPRALGKALRGDKLGLWRYRVQDYRLICQIQDKELIVLLIHTGHRSKVYSD